MIVAREGADAVEVEQPSERAAARRGGRAPSPATVAALAGLIGVLVGSATVLVALGDAADRPGAEELSAQQTGPTIELEGGGQDLDQVAAVAQAVLPTVVRLDSGSGFGAEAYGSGVVYRADGYVVTNEHVVNDRETVNVTFSDGSETQGTVRGTDERTDLAVVEVDRDGLTALPIGESEDLTPGAPAIAVGSPFGLEGTVTSGVISALNRPLQVTTDEGPQQYDNVIQTDAAINPGNSGGPLVGTDGTLLGINSAIFTQGPTPANAGVGFAIPVETVTSVADRLIESGEVEHAFLGVSGEDVTAEVAERVGVSRGAYVEEVLEGTPAEESGLAAEDVIVGVEGDEVASFTELIGRVLRFDVDEEIVVRYVREGDERETTATLSARPEDDTLD